jgi:hypothetical protein
MLKKSWFKPWGWIYRPVAWQGWAAVAVTLAFCTQVFIAVDRHSHSASDTFYGLSPYVAPAAIVLNRLASRTATQR